LNILELLCGKLFNSVSRRASPKQVIAVAGPIMYKNRFNMEYIFNVMNAPTDPKNTPTKIKAVRNST
jgi:hypothetical protein